MKFIPNAVSRTIARQVLLGKKHSPVILFGAGIVGVVGTVVSASKATLKLEETLEETNRNVATAKRLNEQKSEDYTEQDYAKDMTLIYTRGAMAVCKLYAPAIGLGCLSVAALTGSHVILTNRNAALVGAYAALEKGFKEYRERVEKEFGPEKEREVRTDGSTVKTKDETGKKVTTTHAGPDGASIYARFFDELCPPWQRTPEYNMVFLRAQQAYFNDRLLVKGHVFLNEVYDALGIERSKAGQIVGWVVSDEGDNFIDFGIYDNDRESARNFVNGREGAILLDFNVDGPVYDKI